MCLILFAIDTHASLPLIVAANRDEFYQRPTLPAHFWSDHPHVLAGRDLEAGGTWMGMTQDGRFAALTNYRTPSQQRNSNLLSRGKIVADFLTADSTKALSAQSFAEKIIETGDQYSGFNLLLRDESNFIYCNNQNGEISRLSSGVYALSNHLLDTPWPKVEIGKRDLQEFIESTSENVLHSEKPALAEHLFSILNNKQQASDATLPNTGIDKQMEQLLSSLFIESTHYGTCCSTTVLMDAQQHVYFHEKNYYQQAHKTGQFSALQELEGSANFLQQWQEMHRKDNFSADQFFDFHSN